MTRRLRLLKVVVQPVFVIEGPDGELEELRAEPVEVGAREWPTFATGRFEEGTRALRAQLDAGE